jgi:hypothetical protein
VPDGRGARIALEAGFLVVVAAVLAVAAVEPVWIVLVMLLAWGIVALLEWVAWRDEPHWASGSPPRYYVPQQPLPPRPPSRELPAFTNYPRPAPRVSEAPTWIATPAMREELLGWPAVRPPTQADEPPRDDELPQELLAEAAGVAADADVDDEAPGWPVPHEPEHVEDPWIAGALPAEPEQEPAAAPEAVEEPEPVTIAPEPAPEPEPTLPPAALRLAHHRIDPFAEPAARRLPWRRRSPEQTPTAELPVLPRHAALPVRDAAEAVRR